MSDVKIISPENHSRLSPSEFEEMQDIYQKCTEGGKLHAGSRMFNNMLKLMDSRHWAMLDRYYYGFDMGLGPQYPINCYRQSFMGWHLPES